MQVQGKNKINHRSSALNLCEAYARVLVFAGYRILRELCVCFRLIKVFHQWLLNQPLVAISAATLSKCRKRKEKKGDKTKHA